MCPLWPYHYLILAVFLLISSSQITLITAKRIIYLNLPNSTINLNTGLTKSVQFSMKGDLTNQELEIGQLHFHVDDEHVAGPPVPKEIFFKNLQTLPNSNIWAGSINITGNFMGYTNLVVNASSLPDDVKFEAMPARLRVTRQSAVLDKIFTYSVITLVSIIFINFGCALDSSLVKRAVFRPIGPAIGLACHFLILPLISFGLGYSLFPNLIALRLGLFFTGISPAGGASNIWTAMLGGNINLSVTMTTVSTLASFALMPLWVFTLGQLILTSAKIKVPFGNLAESVVLLIPLIIGYLLQIYCKKFSKIMVRILKPFSALLIIFIVVFAIVTNYYLFQLFNWRIAVAGLALPWLGYVAGWILAILFKQTPEDVMAISIETGVQNTGISIFMLRVAFGQPEADLATVAPVAVAIMTPIPLLILYLILKFKKRKSINIPTSTDNLVTNDVLRTTYAI